MFQSAVTSLKICFSFLFMFLFLFMFFIPIYVFHSNLCFQSYLCVSFRFMFFIPVYLFYVFFQLSVISQLQQEMQNLGMIVPFGSAVCKVFKKNEVELQFNGVFRFVWQDLLTRSIDFKVNQNS